MVIQYRLNEMLKLRGVTAKQIATHYGIAESTLSLMRQNKTERVDLATLEKLCKALQCTPGDLLVYIPDPVLPAQPVVAEPSPAYHADGERLRAHPPARKPRTPPAP